MSSRVDKLIVYHSNQKGRLWDLTDIYCTIRREQTIKFYLLSSTWVCYTIYNKEEKQTNKVNWENIVNKCRVFTWDVSEELLKDRRWWDQHWLQHVRQMSPQLISKCSFDMVWSMPNVGWNPPYSTLSIRKQDRNTNTALAASVVILFHTRLLL